MPNDPLECDHGYRDGEPYRPDAAYFVTDWTTLEDPLSGQVLDGRYATAYCPLCEHEFQFVRGVEPSDQSGVPS